MDGGLLGLPLAVSARAEGRPKLGATDFLRPVAALLLMTGAVSLLAGVTGYFLARSGAIGMAGCLASTVPVHRHAAFLAEGWAHMVAYAFGALGGLGLCVRTWRRLGGTAADR